MIKRFTFLFLFLSLLTCQISCKSDDSYVPVTIHTEADFIEVFQNASIEIDVLANDENVPSFGVLTVTASQNASIEVADPSNTPNNLLDDVILYTPDGIFLGEDTFQYTICTAEGDTCASGTVTVRVLPVSPVVFDINAVPYANLSDYNFFEGALAEMVPVYGVLPYEPINSLFTDYALKKRFIWMPAGIKATYAGDHEILNFPLGTVLIKSFYYEEVLPDNKIQLIETRLMIKKESGWIFANYIWNEAQTEASMDLTGGFINIQWLHNGSPKNVNYRIPSQSECFTCHKSSANSIPIGLKPQFLNSDYPYPEGSQNQLQKLIALGYLESGIPSSINTVVNWEDTSEPLDMRMRSYVAINCAHCHSDDRHCDYRPMRFAFNESMDEINMGVCVDPDTSIPPFDKIVDPGNISNSVMHFRMNSTEEQYRMPLLGRTIRHDESIELVESWINSLTTNCN